MTQSVFNGDRFHRQSVRLKGYDYSQGGGYYVTLCTYRRECLFGEIIAGDVRLNAAGVLVKQEWLQTAEVRPGVVLDAFVIMPNHMHGILVLPGSEKDGKNPPEDFQWNEHPRGPIPGSIGAIIAQFNSAATKRLNATRTAHTPVWRRSYHERIIWNGQMLEAAGRCIANNPAKWQSDIKNPANVTQKK